MIEKRKRGRPAGSLSGSIHGVDSNETPHIITQIRHAPKYAEDIELKHHVTGTKVHLNRAVCDRFYDEYFNADKPVDKETLLEEFGIAHFGIARKTSTKVTLYDVIGIANNKMKQKV
jgi:hypothetical protein